METLGKILLALPLVLLVAGMVWDWLFPGPYTEGIHTMGRLTDRCIGDVEGK